MIVLSASFVCRAPAQETRSEDNDTTQPLGPVRLRPVIKGDPNSVTLQPVIQGASQASGSAARDRLAEGRRTIQEGKIDDGRTILMKLAEEMPQAPEAPEALLIAAESLQDLDAARSELRALVGKHPQSPAAVRALAQIGEYSFVLGDYAESVKAYEAYVALEPKPEAKRGARIQLALARLNLGEFEPAGRDFEALMKDFSDLAQAPEMFEGRADALLGLGRVDAAAGQYADIEKRFPNYAFIAKVMMSRALCAELRGEPAEASKIYQGVARDHPRSIEAALAARRLTDLGRGLLP